MIDAKVLRGHTLEDAQCYGMPHLGAHYYADGVNYYTRDTDLCTVCGMRATNTHHHPPKGKARRFTLATPNGVFRLKPALIALCGSGTTGCHGLIHNRKVLIRWKWYSEENQEKWFSGYYLSHGIEPHSERLYEFGCWTIGDGITEVELRGMDHGIR